MKVIIVTFVLLATVITTTAQARCRCICVDGREHQVCKNDFDVRKPSCREGSRCSVEKSPVDFLLTIGGESSEQLKLLENI